MNGNGRMKVAVWGCGPLGRVYARSAARFSEYEVAVCAAEDREAAEALARECGIDGAASPEEMLARDDIGLVVNVTGLDERAAASLRVLKAGKAVYSASLLARRRREAREILGYAREKKLPVGCAPDSFLGPALRLCREVIDRGEIGEPVGGEARIVPGVRCSAEDVSGASFKKGAEFLFEHGPAYMAALGAILGPVTAVSGAFAGGSGSSRPAASLLEFASGPVVSLLASCGAASAALAPIEIHGTLGTLRIPHPAGFGGPVALVRPGAREPEYLNVPSWADDDLTGLGIAEMVAAMRGEREPRASGRAAYHVLDALHSIVDSAECGRRLELASSMARPAAVEGERFS